MLEDHRSVVIVGGRDDFAVCKHLAQAYLSGVVALHEVGYCFAPVLLIEVIHFCEFGIVLRIGRLGNGLSLEG